MSAPHSGGGCESYVYQLVPPNTLHTLDTRVISRLYFRERYVIGSMYPPRADLYTSFIRHLTSATTATVSLSQL